ncbi:GTP-binding protein [Pseudomonas fluorescens]|uniref:GTP-binding protein n=1 Tax=Pseudomonas fluorescens TaxID=294 RepID=UPI001A9FA1B4|nr:GTP-binding protein [Pseudomonas fluorescens]QTD31492.1 hypothetical protein JZM58_19600 [Pseudomonas fluorescens]
MTDKPRKNVLIIGEAKSGKSTLLGALLHHSNTPTVARIDPADTTDAWKYLPKKWKDHRDYCTKLWQTGLDRATSEKTANPITLGLIELSGFEVFIYSINGPLEQANTAFLPSIDFILLVIPAGVGEYEKSIGNSSGIWPVVQLAHDQLAVNKVIVAVSKMDTTEPPYSLERYNSIDTEIRGRLRKSKYDFSNTPIVPVCSIAAGNLFQPDTNFVNQPAELVMLPGMEELTLAAAFKFMFSKT